jgi:ribosomal-protein-alanine N-acetyltransferase
MIDAHEMVHIRAMQSGDLDTVRELDHLSFSLPWPDNAYRYELFENTAALLYVAESASGQVVGFIVVWMVIDEAHIATLGVHPDWRGRNLAGELLSVGLQDAIARGMTSATLEVRRGNLAAQRLYTRFKFEEVGLRVRYYRDNNEDALIMTVSHLDERYIAWLQTGAWKR